MDTCTIDSLVRKDTDISQVRFRGRPKVIPDISSSPSYGMDGVLPNSCVTELRQASRG